MPPVVGSMPPPVEPSVSPPVSAAVPASLASVAPHVAGGASVPWGRLALMLGGMLVVGFCVAAAATAGILRVPVVPALRRE